MNLLIIGGSSFIGKNLIAKLPTDWNIRATYNTSESFIDFAKGYCNVEPLKLDLTKNNIPDFGSSDVIMYLAGISPGQDDGSQIDGLNIMDFLHAKAISLVLEKATNCKKFIYFASGIYYLLNNFSDYRKSRLLGEANVKTYAGLHGCDYIIIRNMEIYGQYMPAHKIYRKISEAAINGIKEININGDGNNLVDTMYIDDYVEIIIKMLNSSISNKTIDVCKSSPVSIRELIDEIFEVAKREKPKVNFYGKPSENTNFTADNSHMIELLNFVPKISLQEGLRNWINEGLK